MLRTALFVTYGGGHVNIVIPIVRALEREPNWRVLVLGATAAGPALQRAGIPYIGYRDLLTPQDQDALTYGEMLLADSHDPASGISREESIAYLGLCYKDLVERLGAAEAEARYKKWKRHAFLPLGPLRRVISRWQPDIVVTTNSPKSERAALVVAAEYGIATFGVEDGFALRPKHFPDFVPEFKADRYGVYSTIARDNWQAQGIPAEAIRLTGCPSFDGIAAFDQEEARTRIRDRWGMGAGDYVCLFTGQAYTSYERLRELVLATTADLPHLRFALRRHPTRRAMDPVEFLRWMGPRCVLAETEALYDVIAGSDVVVSVSSTTAQEAVLLGRPLVQVGKELALTEARWENAADMPLYQLGISLLARSEQELAEHLRRMADPAEATAWRNRLWEYLVPPGGAAERVVREIIELALVRPERYAARS